MKEIVEGKMMFARAIAKTKGIQHLWKEVGAVSMSPKMVVKGVM